MKHKINEKSVEMAWVIDQLIEAGKRETGVTVKTERDGNVLRIKIREFGQNEFTHLRLTVEVV